MVIFSLIIFSFLKYLKLNVFFIKIMQDFDFDPANPDSSDFN